MENQSSTPSTELVPHEGNYIQQIQKENQENAELILKTYFPSGNQAQFKLFMAVANKRGLSPIAGQITPMIRRSKNKDTDQWEEKMSIITTIDGLRLIAERTGRYQGQTPVQWCGQDGIWKEVWTSTDKYPTAAKVGVYKAGFKEPLYAVARFKSYAQTYYSKKSKKYELTPTWQNMPDLMIAKVAEALALRKAFPEDTSGLYAKEEMDQMENEVVEPKDVTPKQSETNTNQVGNASSKESAPKAQKQVIKQVASREEIEQAPWKYTITFGKYAGKKLSEIDYDELKQYMNNFLYPEMEARLQRKEKIHDHALWLKHFFELYEFKFGSERGASGNDEERDSGSQKETHGAEGSDARGYMDSVDDIPF